MAATGGDFHQLQEGMVVNGKYRIEKLLGEGGFGITYLARDTVLEIPVAVKEYYPAGYVTRDVTMSTTVTSFTGDKQEVYEQGKEKFIREAQTLGKLIGQDGVVWVRDYFQENNTAYIVMEYLDGMSLKEYLKQAGGQIVAEEAFKLIEPVVRSLVAVHEQNLVHRDISPDNIMVLPGRKVKLLDFGAAREITKAGEKSLSVMLKPGYAPEEQYRTRGEQGPWSDVYALCATVYRCITGHVPVEAMERIRRDTLPWPSSLGVQIDSRKEAVLMKGLAVFQEDRIRDMKELYAGWYQGGYAGQPMAAGQPTAAQQPAGWQSEDVGRTVPMQRPMVDWQPEDVGRTVPMQRPMADWQPEDVGRTVPLQRQMADWQPEDVGRTVPLQRPKAEEQPKVAERPTADKQSKADEQPTAAQQPTADEQPEDRRKKRLPLFIGGAAAVLVGVIVLIVALVSRGGKDKDLYVSNEPTQESETGEPAPTSEDDPEQELTPAVIQAPAVDTGDKVYGHELATFYDGIVIVKTRHGLVEGDLCEDGSVVNIRPLISWSEYEEFYNCLIRENQLYVATNFGLRRLDLKGGDDVWITRKGVHSLLIKGDKLVYRSGEIIYISDLDGSDEVKLDLFYNGEDGDWDVQDEDHVFFTWPYFVYVRDINLDKWTTLIQRSEYRECNTVPYTDEESQDEEICQLRVYGNTLFLVGKYRVYYFDCNNETIHDLAPLNQVLKNDGFMTSSMWRYGDDFVFQAEDADGTSYILLYEPDTEKVYPLMDGQIDYMEVLDDYIYTVDKDTEVYRVYSRRTGAWTEMTELNYNVTYE